MNVKTIHYVMVGFLAILTTKESEVQHVIDSYSYRELEDMELCKWYKDMILPMAATNALVEASNNGS